MPVDRDLLQGSWRLTALETDGSPTPAGALTGASIAITGQTFRSTGMGETYEGRFELDETSRPRTIDLIFTSGPQAGTRNLGIYTLKGHTWTICIATRGTTRPSAFATAPGSGLALETLRRDSRAERDRGESSAPAAGRPPAIPAGSGPATDLEGEWTMTAAVFNGAPMSDEMVAYCTRVTRGDVTTVLAGPKVMMSARFTLDAAASPRAIDYVNLVGANAGSTQAGIYEVAGDELRISMALPGKPRPKDFATAKGDGRTLTAFRRTRT